MARLIALSKTGHVIRDLHTRLYSLILMVVAGGGGDLHSRLTDAILSLRSAVVGVSSELVLLHSFYFISPGAILIYFWVVECTKNWHRVLPTILKRRGWNNGVHINGMNWYPVRVGIICL